ncbi:hypothetical protein [Streptomyces liangshanensis]|uniref:hypothetical protein n=1 Tax=Streptomyces liangshanensis TaxID=2717324 RepID=UPI0036DAB005
MYVQVETQKALARWLMSTIRTPDVAWQDWLNGRPAVLRTGVHFDAVRMPMELVHAAFSSTQPEIVSGGLAEVLDGPVIADPAAYYYALVPAGTAETWRSVLGVVRGRGGWLVVPRLDRTDPGGPYWAVPPVKVGKLCGAVDVAELLRVGQARLDGTTP